MKITHINNSDSYQVFIPPQDFNRIMATTCIHCQEHLQQGEEAMYVEHNHLIWWHTSPICNPVQSEKRYKKYAKVAKVAKKRLKSIQSEIKIKSTLRKREAVHSKLLE